MPDPVLKPASWDDIITATAKAQGVNPSLALAVANRESSLNPDAVGDGGKAIGMFQLHPGAATDTGTEDRSDPLQNIQGGVKYLKQLSDRYKGDVSKALMAYNGGMEAVDAGTPSAQAQAYATAVMSGLTRQAVKKPSGPASADPGAPSKAKSGNMFTDVQEGFAKASVKHGMALVNPMVEKLRKRFPNLFEKNPQPPLSTEPTNMAQKVGAAVEPVAEFAVGQGAAGLATKAIGLTGAIGTAAESAAQAGTMYGVSKYQGADEGSARINAAIGAAGPLVSKAFEVAAPKIRERAIKSLSQVFAKGLENKGPMVTHALKTGDAATPEVARSARIVQRAAADTLELPVQLSWGKWQTTLAKDASHKGQTLAKALQGSFGREQLPKQPIVDALDALIDESAQHFAQVSEGGFKYLPFNDKLLKEAKILKSALEEYHDTISVKNLVDLKRTWDDAVYGLSTVGKVGVSPEVLVSNAMKEAMATGADSVRAVLDKGAPAISELNEAFSHARQLQDLVAKLYKVNPAMGDIGHAVSWAAGGAIGSQLVPGLHGVFLGGVAGRLVASALESPAWQTASSVVKDRLAKAIVTGNTNVIRELTAPFVAGAVVNAQKPQTGASTPPRTP